MKRYEWLVSVCLVLVSLCIGYLLVEASYRIYTYTQIKSVLVKVALAGYAQLEGGTSLFDPDTGYRYRPNITVERRDGPFPIFWKTNRHGHIARNDYTVEKPPHEFRIGLVGDSMTANVTNTIRWGDVVEDTLNQSPEWKTFVGGRQTRVINGGLDGIGTVQFDDVAEHLVKPFDVDLLIINMIEGDVARRPYFRGNTQALNPQDVERWVMDLAINQMPWWGFYPEALAHYTSPIRSALKKSPRLNRVLDLYPFLAPPVNYVLNIEARLSTPQAARLLVNDRHYTSAEEAAQKSAEAAKRIPALFSRTLWLLHPIYQDYAGYESMSASEAALFRESFKRFQDKVPEIKFVPMIDRLPKPASRAEADSWFNVPHDQHYSDKGFALYGETVARILLEQARSGAMGGLGRYPQ